MLTHGGKYYTPHTPLPLPLYEGYVSVRHNVTYIYYVKHMQRGVGVSYLPPYVNTYIYLFPTDP